MKSIVLAVALLIAFSTLASAQAGFRLEFYADEGLSSCELAVTSPGMVKVHMLVTGPGALSSISFKAPRPECMRNATWLADLWVQPPMIGYAGNTQGTVGNGVDVGVDVFFSCRPLPQYIGWIWYTVTGPADPCCAYAPSPGSFTGDIPYPGYMFIIAFQQCPAYSSPQYDPRMTAKGLVMNADVTCRCDLPVSVESTTWGAVKALYR